MVALHLKWSPATMESTYPSSTPSSCLTGGQLASQNIKKSSKEWTLHFKHAHLPVVLQAIAAWSCLFEKVKKKWEEQTLRGNDHCSLIQNTTNSSGGLMGGQRNQVRSTTKRAEHRIGRRLTEWLAKGIRIATDTRSNNKHSLILQLLNHSSLCFIIDP